MKDNQWVEVYDEETDTTLQNGTIIVCEYENRPIGFGKVAVPVIDIHYVPDIIAAAMHIAQAYSNPKIKPLEFAKMIQDLDALLKVRQEETIRAW